MQEAAAQTDFTIAVLSEAYLKSAYTQPEWAAAFAQDPTGKKRKLIPVRVAACSLAGMLTPILHIDLIGLGEPAAKASPRSHRRFQANARNLPSQALLSLPVLQGFMACQ